MVLGIDNKIEQAVKNGWFFKREGKALIAKHVNGATKCFNNEYMFQKWLDSLEDND